MTPSNTPHRLAREATAAELADEAHKRISFSGFDDMLHAIIDRLASLALPQLEEQQRWMPISSAPKDGTLFLCWVSAVRYGETDDGQQYQEDVSQADFCNWRTQADIPDCGWFDPCCGQIGDQQDVTYWMPLPPPPTQDTTTQEKPNE